jgi:hypothetical protein
MNTVLYYPHLYPPTEWLRVAALCWDEVYTLLPPEAPDMPEEVARLDAALGKVLRPASIKELQNDRDIADKFEAWLDDSDGDQNASAAKSNSEEWFALLRPKVHMDLEDKLNRRGVIRYGSTRERVRVPRWLKATVERQSGEYVISRG